MYLNNFSVRVPEGTELAGGYVEMEHGTQYTLRLRNSYAVRRCDAQVKIDGKHIGTFRIDPNSTIALERPAHDSGRFTFYKSGTKDAKIAGLDSVNNLELGLIEVTFTPESVDFRPAGMSYTVYRTASTDYKGAYYTTNTSDGYAVSEVTTGGTTPSNSYTVAYTKDSGLESGGTGLSGFSTQNFENAAAINYDYSFQTTIHLRLVAKRKDNRPRPLTQFSNPIPPVVGK